MNPPLRVLIDDIGYAAIINIDYAHNDEEQAKTFFNHLFTNLLALGFNFDNRLFFKIGSSVSIEEDLKKAVLKTKSETSADPNNFLRSVHIVPLSQFREITQSLAAV